MRCAATCDSGAGERALKKEDLRRCPRSCLGLACSLGTIIPIWTPKVKRQVLPPCRSIIRRVAETVARRPSGSGVVPPSTDRIDLPAHERHAPQRDPVRGRVGEAGAQIVHAWCDGGKWT